MPVATTTVSDQLIQDCIVRSVQGVFRTMMGNEVSFVEQLDASKPTTSQSSSEVVGSVGFIGAANGLIYLMLSEEFAKLASGKILGMSPSEIEAHGNEVIHDAIGEITNMTVGGFKNTLCDMGFPCKLTLPAIVRGHKLSIAAIKAATRHIFRFECSGHQLLADIQIKFD